jgi:hypothetical protein
MVFCVVKMNLKLIHSSNLKNKIHFVTLVCLIFLSLVHKISVKKVKYKFLEMLTINFAILPSEFLSLKKTNKSNVRKKRYFKLYLCITQFEGINRVIYFNNN